MTPTTRDTRPDPEARVDALARALLLAIPGYVRWMEYPISTRNETDARSEAAETEARNHAAAILAALSADGWGVERRSESERLALLSRLVMIAHNEMPERLNNQTRVNVNHAAAVADPLLDHSCGECREFLAALGGPDATD